LTAALQSTLGLSPLFAAGEARDSWERAKLGRRQAAEVGRTILASAGNF